MIKYRISFLINIIKENFWKSFTIFLALASIYPTMHIDPYIYRENDIISNFTYNGTPYSIILNPRKNNSNSSDFSIFENNEGNSKITTKSMTTGYFFSVVLLTITSLISIVIIIVSILDGDLWSISDIKPELNSKFVECELEEGFFYYTIFGRLLAKTDRQLSSYQIKNLEWEISTLSNLPRFKSKSRNRISKLNKLGINI
jgi:hypothetical protein